jgi:hypothetical protein
MGDDTSMGDDNQMGIEIWYQVLEEGRSAMPIGFDGQYIADLQEEIAKKSQLLCAPDQLKLFVKKQGSDEEMSLHDIRKELKKDFSFERMVDEYEITEDNPILVRLPGMLLSSLLFCFCQVA